MLATDGDRVALQNGKLNFSQLRGRRQRAMPKAAEDIDFAVMDPGRVSWLSILHARLCVKDKEIEMLGWTTVPGKVYQEAMSSYVQLQKYDEERRKKSKVYQGIAYKDAIDLCKATRKKTCVLQTYEKFCQASVRAAPAFMYEQGQVHRNKLKFRLRVESRKNMDALVKEICGSRKNKIDAVFFGQGNVNGARGSPCVGSKKVMRAFARRVRTCTINEWGTSSRCFSCQERDTKVQRRDLEQLPTIETQLSGLPCSLIRNGVHVNDKRCEYCSKCSRCVPHDLISLFNMLSIATAILLRKPRPDYLCPSWAEKKQEEELGVAAQH